MRQQRRTRNLLGYYTALGIKLEEASEWVCVLCVEWALLGIKLEEASEWVCVLCVEWALLGIKLEEASEWVCVLCVEWALLGIKLEEASEWVCVLCVEWAVCMPYDAPPLMDGDGTACVTTRLLASTWRKQVR
jgi:hypothetical protein